MDHPGPLRAGCIVLDVWMPGRGGLDLQAELVRTGKSLPIIFISGHADVHTSVRAMKAGAIDFLTKPVRHQDLLDAIRSAVACTTQQAPLQGLTQLNRY
jgi:FixJ family two-component response regulator